MKVRERQLKYIQDKRADIPITILVLGVIFICILAIGSFFLFGNKMKRVFLGSDLIEQMNSEIEKYHLYKNLEEFSQEEIMNILNAKTDSLGDYIYLEKIEKEKKLISVRYYFSE